jgi:RNA polymerase sigma-70 factor (ECF subfamily)
MSILDPQQGRPPPPPADARQELCRYWYEEHGRAIYSYLRFQLGSADEADDLTADVFLRAVRSADRFDPIRGTARSWLFRIAQNVLRDHGRRERRRRLVPLTGFRDLHADAPSPEEQVLRREEVGCLLEALADLPAADRELVSLRYGSGLSTAEVAEVLGVREPAVRTRLWRALGRLRKAMRP